MRSGCIRPRLAADKKEDPEVSARRDLPKSYGPHTNCYNRFVRWRQAGVWDQIMDALAAAHNAAAQMIDTSVVRVHQHGACIACVPLLELRSVLGAAAGFC